MIKHVGTHIALKKRLASMGVHGKWVKLADGIYQFRTVDGAILNWWRSTKTVNFQGPKLEAEQLKQAFLYRSQPD